METTESTHISLPIMQPSSHLNKVAEIIGTLIKYLIYAQFFVKQSILTIGTE